MTQQSTRLTRALLAVRKQILSAGPDVIEAGWQDLAEAIADVDVAVAAMKLQRPEGLARARVLLSPEGPIRLLASQQGWDLDLSDVPVPAEPALAA